MLQPGILSLLRQLAKVFPLFPADGVHRLFLWRTVVDAGLLPWVKAIEYPFPQRYVTPVAGTGCVPFSRLR